MLEIDKEIEKVILKFYLNYEIILKFYLDYEIILKLYLNYEINVLLTSIHWFFLFNSYIFL